MADCYFLPFEFPERAAHRTRRVWVAPVSSRQQETWGTLCAMIHLPESVSNAQHTVDELCDLFTSLYYPTSHVPRGKQTPKQWSESRNIQFEELLQELNTAFQNPERFGLGRNAEEFDLLLAAIHSDEILIANHRQSQAWFLAALDSENRTEGERLECLTRTIAKPRKFFSDVTSGSIETGETLILASDGFFDVWSPDTVAHLIDTAKSTGELIEVLAQEGETSDASQQAALFVLGLNPEDAQAPGDEPKAETALPDARALAQQAVLSVTPLFQSLLHSTATGARWSARTGLRSLRWMISHRSEIPGVLRSAVEKIRRFALLVPKIGLGLWSVIRTLALMIGLGVAMLVVHRPTQDSILKALEQEPAARVLRLAPAGGTHAAARLKGISVAMILLFVLGAGGLTRMQYERIRVREQQRAQSISEKTTQAQARLIYGNDTEAKSLLEEARLLLHQLPDRSGDATKATIAKELDELARQLRHEVKLADPSARIAVPSTATELAFFNGTLVAATPDSLLVFDGRALKTKNVPRTIPLPPALIQSLDHIELVGSTVLIHDRNRIHRIPLAEKSPTPVTVTLPPGVGTVHTVFSGRLYSTDATGRQLLKLNPAGNGWAAPSPWLDASTTLPEGVTQIGVDGSLFVATNSSISKFYRGKSEAFPTSIEPPLSKARSLVVPEASSFLFFVDSHNRVIVIDKGTQKNQTGGRTVAQIVKPEWTTLRDAAIDTKTKTLTVLVDGRIEQYPLPVLK